MRDYATKEDVKEIVTEVITDLVPAMIDHSIERNNKKIEIMLDHKIDELIGVISRNEEQRRKEDVKRDHMLMRHDRHIKELGIKLKATLI